MRRAISELPFAQVGSLTISAGVCDIADAEDATALFRLADLALYWVKTNGRDATFRYSPQVLELLSGEEQAHRLSRARAISGIRVLAQAVDAKDPSTQRHSERVADLAVNLAQELGWPEDRVALLHEAALVHDVGKIGIPDTLLLKPGPLDPDEYEVVKTHPALGAQMVADALSPEQAEWIRCHHERLDGTGYPVGLGGDGLSDGSRILALADAWDAMTWARPYRVPLRTREALAEVRLHAGTQFCPRVAAALSRLWTDGVDALPAPSPGRRTLP
jgi:HD-GYP domain-containing protein (c-di-GMP phosphodiesterase class II)